MGHKVRISEVIEFSEKQYNIASNMMDGIQSVRTSIHSLNSMNTFKGKSADSAKAHFQKVHGTILDAFDELFLDIQMKLSDHIQAFKSEVDTNNNAIIEINYLIDRATKITTKFEELEQQASNISGTIRSVSDISSVTSPNLTTVTNRQGNVIDTLEQLEEKLVTFTKSGRNDRSQTNALINRVNQLLIKLSAKSGVIRFTHSFDAHVGAISDVVETIAFTRIVHTSKSLYFAGKDGILTTSTHRDMSRNGRMGYRINANRLALERLGVTPDGKANSQLNYRLPKDGRALNAKYQERARANVATLKYANQKPGQTGWSHTGQQVLKMHPELRYFNDKVKAMHVIKSTGKGALKGAIDGIADPFKIKEYNFKQMGAVKSVSKGFGVAGLGLTAYTNYNEARDEGLTGKDLTKRVAVDTTVDAVVSGAIQAGFTAAGTALIPIPGVGTAVGMVAGIAVNTLLNIEFGKSNKSTMDRLKGWFR